MTLRTRKIGESRGKAQRRGRPYAEGLWSPYLGCVARWGRRALARHQLAVGNRPRAVIGRRIPDGRSLVPASGLNLDSICTHLAIKRFVLVCFNNPDDPPGRLESPPGRTAGDDIADPRHATTTTPSNPRDGHLEGQRGSNAERPALWSSAVTGFHEGRRWKAEPNTRKGEAISCAASGSSCSNMSVKRLDRRDPYHPVISAPHGLSSRNVTIHPVTRVIPKRSRA